MIVFAQIFRAMGVQAWRIPLFSPSANSTQETVQARLFKAEKALACITTVSSLPGLDPGQSNQLRNGLLDERL